VFAVAALRPCASIPPRSLAARHGFAGNVFVAHRMASLPCTVWPVQKREKINKKMQEQEERLLEFEKSKVCAVALSTLFGTLLEVCAGPLLIGCERGAACEGGRGLGGQAQADG
jgi:hypothetical protein